MGEVPEPDRSPGLDRLAGGGPIGPVPDGGAATCRPGVSCGATVGAPCVQEACFLGGPAPRCGRRSAPHPSSLLQRFASPSTPQPPWLPCFCPCSALVPSKLPRLLVFFSLSWLLTIANSLRDGASSGFRRPNFLMKLLRTFPRAVIWGEAVSYRRAADVREPSGEDSAATWGGRGPAVQYGIVREVFTSSAPFGLCGQRCPPQTSPGFLFANTSFIRSPFFCKLR